MRVPCLAKVEKPIPELRSLEDPEELGLSTGRTSPGECDGTCGWAFTGSALWFEEMQAETPGRIRLQGVCA